MRLIFFFLFIALCGQAQPDSPPLFEGCNDPLISEEQRILCSNEKLREYIAKKMNYPDSAAAQKIEGLVVLRFTVDAQGTVTMVELLKGLERTCNEEALRLIRSLPKFTPAQKEKLPVESQLTVPIRFVLKDILHHPNEDLYRIHWAKTFNDSISRKQLQGMLSEMPFVRDAKGFNYTFKKLELTYIKGQKVASAEIDAGETWSEEMLEILQNARRGGILVFSASIIDGFKSVEVLREFYVE